MKEILIATGNPGKYAEIAEGLRDLPITPVFLGDLGIRESGIEEDGDTFRENAYKKAEYYFGKVGMPTLAEDSGVLVEALKGELGLKTRRWGAGEKANDEEWLRFFMKRMEGVNNRRALFVCNVCFFEGATTSFFEGQTKGVITEDLRAPIIPGVPLSSCFLPEGGRHVYAALTAEEKNKISHRGKAVFKTKLYLKKRLEEKF